MNWLFEARDKFLDQNLTNLSDFFRRAPYSLEIFVVVFVFLSGALLAFVGPGILLVLVGVLVIFLNTELLVYLLVIALTVDFTWISEYLRFLPDMIALVIFLKSLVFTNGIPIWRSITRLPLFFLACCTLVGLIVNYQGVTPGSFLYGLRVLFLDLLIFVALLRFKFPITFYQRVIYMLFALMLLQIPFQIIERSFGWNWPNINYAFETPWDNNSGTFGLNGTLKLTSLCMIVFAISLSEIVFRKRIWFNVAMILGITLSLAISESKYGLILIPILTIYLTRHLWMESIGNILQSIIMMFFVLLFFWIGLINLTQLSGVSSNYILDDPTTLWQAQFFTGDTTTAVGLPGRLGVYTLIDQYRQQKPDGNLQTLFGNGLGSTADSSFSLLQGYLFRTFPFDELGRTDASRIWIEYGAVGSLVFFWLYLALLWRSYQVSSAPRNEDQHLMAYTTTNCIVIAMTLFPYSPVTMGAISGFAVWLMASNVEIMFEHNQKVAALQARQPAKNSIDVESLPILLPPAN